MSQNEWVLAALQEGPITPMDALRGCGCLRLAARVRELRQQGHNIVSTLVTENGKAFARYTLAKEKKNGR